MPRMQISRRHTVKSKYPWMLSRASRPPLTHAIPGRYDCILTRVATQSSSKKSHMRTFLLLKSIWNLSLMGHCSYEVLADPDKRAV